MLFKENELYIFDLTGKIKFYNIEEKELIKLFKDGRVSGIIAEKFLETEFENLKRMELESANVDILNTRTASRYEVRTITKGGVNLIPSKMIGKGRKYNEEEYILKLQFINYFLFVDVRNLPILYIYSKSKDYFFNPIKKCFNSRQADLFLEEFRSKVV